MTKNTPKVTKNNTLGQKRDPYRAAGYPLRKSRNFLRESHVYENHEMTPHDPLKELERTQGKRFSPAKLLHLQKEMVTTPSNGEYMQLKPCCTHHHTITKGNIHPWGTIVTSECNRGLWTGFSRLHSQLPLVEFLILKYSSLHRSMNIFYNIVTVVTKWLARIGRSGRVPPPPWM